MLRLLTLKLLLNLENQNYKAKKYKPKIYSFSFII